MVVILLSAIIAFGPRGEFAQEPEAECSQLKYSKPAARALRRLDNIVGVAVFEPEKGDPMSASGLCVALFARSDRRLLAAVKTNANDGEFQFTNIAPGEYVLVAGMPSLHEIIIPVRLGDRTAGKAFKHHQLLLHMRAKENAKKSFVSTIANPDLREELLKRLVQDQEIRDDMIRMGLAQPDKAMAARMATIDRDNTARMKEIVENYGWPGPELVGIDGTQAAFLLVQHAPELAFQKAMLPLVRNAFRARKLSGWDYALLVDRVRVRQGKPQMYGMSLNHWQGREPVLDPIMDESKVDKRRARIGLSPLSEYLDFMRKLYFPESKEKR